MPKVKLVGVVVDGRRTIHAPNALGDYDTLCGLDGTKDAVSGHDGLFHPLPSEKIDCASCYQIWLTASQVGQSQFHKDVLLKRAAREEAGK